MRSLPWVRHAADRRATDTTVYAAETSHKSYDGTALSESTSSPQGTTSLVRDAAGSLASHVSDTGDVTWDLLDGLASTVAGGTGASITQLSSYEDWGAQIFETTGWDAPENYTGHAHDPTQGLADTYARTYDPGTGSWTSPDTWRGLLTQPKSLARYQYVWDNPASYLDPDGHLCARRNSTDALPLGCGPTQTPQVTRPVPANPPPPVPIFDRDGEPIVYADGPNSKNNESVRHECPAGTVRYISPYVSPQCVNAAALRASDQRARLWLECDALCREAWFAFGNVLLNAGVVPGLVMCGASLPVGGIACASLDPEAVAAFVDSLYGWQDAEFRLWAEQFKRWRG